MTKILIADDHEIILDGYSSILSNVPDIEVVGKAFNGLEVITVLENITPDIVLLDINMPKMNGIETAKYLREHRPGIRIIIMTMLNSLLYIKELVENAHVDGYLLKNCGKKILLDALSSVMADKPYFDSKVKDIISRGFKQTFESHDQSVLLSEREVEVIRMVALGMTTNKIAQELYISPHTVHTHRKNINLKLNVKNPAELTQFAINKGILPQNFS